MEKEPTIDEETCCSSQLESEFSLFGSTSLDQSNRTSKHCSQDFAEFGGRRKKRNIGFGTETQRFMLPALPCSVSIENLLRRLVQAPTVQISSGCRAKI